MQGGTEDTPGGDQDPVSATIPKARAVANIQATRAMPTAVSIPVKRMPRPAPRNLSVTSCAVRPPDRRSLSGEGCITGARPAWRRQPIKPVDRARTSSVPPLSDDPPGSRDRISPVWSRQRTPPTRRIGSAVRWVMGTNQQWHAVGRTPQAARVLRAGRTERPMSKMGRSGMSEVPQTGHQQAGPGCFSRCSRARIRRASGAGSTCLSRAGRG